MSKLTYVLKLFDIYGNYFQLRINNQTKFKTAIGGFFTIITIAVLTLCIFSFGSDFFGRKNPKVITEEGLYEDREIPQINGDQYPTKLVAIMISSSMDNISKLKVTYIANNTRNFTYLQRCDNDLLLSSFGLNATLLNSYVYYCFNTNDFSIGNQNGGDKFSISPADCKIIPQDVLNNYISNGVPCDTTNSTITVSGSAVNVVSKEVGFNPALDNPFNKRVTTFNFAFTNALYNNLYFDLLLNYLNDDVGWLLQDNEDSIEIGISKSDQSANTLSTPTRIPNFTIFFELSYKYTKFYRSYAKLQDVLAALGGFMKLVLTLLNAFSMLIRNYLIDLYIIDQKYELPLNEGNKSKNELASNPTKNKTQQETINKEIHNNSQQSKYPTNIKLHNNYIESKTLPSSATTTSFHYNKIPNICTYSYAIILNTLNCKERKKKDSFINLLRKRLTVVNTFQDYSYVMRKLNELDTIKKVLFNEKQQLCFEYLAKPYGSDVDPMISQTFSTIFNSEHINREELIEYYVRIINTEMLVGVDGKIYECLSEDIKGEINKKINK